MVKLYVGNLDVDQSNTSAYVTSEDLRKLFSSYGELTEVERLVGKNFGFVHLKDESKARQACRDLNRHVLKGNKLRVEFSAPKPVKIFVGGLSPETSSIELRDLFEEQYVRVLECDVIKKKDKDHFGFVHIDCSEGYQVADKVIAALNKTTLNGSVITVALSEPREEPWSGPGGRGGRGGFMPPPGLRGGMFPPGGLRGGGRPTLFEDRSPYPQRMGGPHGMGGYPGMGGPAGMSGPSGMGGPAGYGRGGMGGSFRGGPGMMRPMGPSGGGYFTTEFGKNHSEKEVEEANGGEQLPAAESCESLLVRMDQELAALVQKDFAEKLWSRQRKEEMCDMMILCHGRNFACHRLILATKSPVMNEMLRVCGSSINVLEFGPSIMEHLLTFMYTGMVDVSQMSHDSIGTLLAAAAHYKVNFCEEAVELGLAKMIKAGNAVDTLLFAVENVLKGLRNAAILFIVENSREIMNKPQEKMKLKMYPDVMMELFEAMTDK